MQFVLQLDQTRGYDTAAEKKIEEAALEAGFRHIIRSHRKVLGKTFVDIEALREQGQDPERYLWEHASTVRAVLYRESGPDMMACFQFARAHGVLQIVHGESDQLDKAIQILRRLQSFVGERCETDSILCTMNVDTGRVRELSCFEGVIEAPNWLHDGRTLLYNKDGRIYAFDMEKKSNHLVDTGHCVQCNNDHVPSPDNRLLAVSCTPEDLPQGTYESRIYVLPLATSGQDYEVITPRDLTGPGCSFLHGWSPDGSTLVYCAFRQNPGEQARRVEICIIPSQGGEEVCLTDGIGYNDGPEYSPDGKHIWFNSTRGGLMQVWRMEKDGSHLTQMTTSKANNWFGHVSPDGKRVVYLSFVKGELDPEEHLPNMQVQLHMMDYDGSNEKKLLDVFGGQGTINVNSWSPDSKEIAFVKYVLHHK